MVSQVCLHHCFYNYSCGRESKVWKNRKHRWLSSSGMPFHWAGPEPQALHVSTFVAAALDLNNSGYVGARTCAGSAGLIRLTERARCDADSIALEERATGGGHPLGFFPPQRARKSCSIHRWIPDKQTFINYKMKIDNLRIPICVLTKHHAYRGEKK